MSDKYKNIENKCQRKIELSLCDEDVQGLYNKAAMGGITVNELLENFIADLVGGTSSNGSDERELADAWFDRTWFGMFPEKNFICYLSRECLLEEFIQAIETRDSTKNWIMKQEKEIMDHNNDVWKVIVDSDNVPCYESRGEWEAEEREDIQFEKEILEGVEDTIQEIWKGFLSWTSLGDDLELEEEIKKFKDWSGAITKVKEVK